MYLCLCTITKTTALPGQQHYCGSPGIFRNSPSDTFALPQASSSFLGDVLSWVGLGVEVEVEVEEAAKDVGDTKIPVKVELMKEDLHNPLNEAGEDDIYNEDKAPPIIDEL